MNFAELVAHLEEVETVQPGEVVQLVAEDGTVVQEVTV